MQVHQTPTILLTRPQDASQRFAEGLRGARVVIAPLMEIVQTGTDVSLDGIAGLILTSETAVRFVPPNTLPAYCVGPRTAEVARAAGMDAKVMGPDADGLIHALKDRPVTGRLLHLHGVHTRGDVADRLRAAGLMVNGIAVYDQREVAPDATFKDALTQPALIVPLFSPRSATLFAQAARTLRNDTRILALSQAVAETLPPEMYARTHVILAPNGAEMRAALARYGVGRNSP